jgi:aspartyl-tRNA(Asn)/glutamyl-tRNA(Gln) amidotransferase subunit A
MGLCRGRASARLSQLTLTMTPMNDTDFAFASIEEVAKLFRKRKLSPMELTKLMLARIEQLNPKLNAYITVTAELALAQAKKAEAELFAPRGRKGHLDRGPLHGIPISLKDNIYTQGIRTTAGSKILSDFVPQHDAPVVTMLKAAGAVILGKTNMHEFAYGVTSNNPHYGPVRNPWDLERIPGGSSGGSAAAVAAGLCYGSIGTDTGGSIRIPAALCGIVGLKPTWGRISCEGVVPLSPALDCTGPLARTVRDAAILTEAIYLRVAREPDLSKPATLRLDTRKICLGIPRQLFFDALSTEVRQAFDSAVRDLCKAGMTITDISIPLLDEVEEAGNHLAWVEALLFHSQQGYFPARASDYGEDVRSRLETGAKVSALDYLQALEIQKQLVVQLHIALAESDADAIIVPTTPIVAPLMNEETTRIGAHEYPTRALLLRLNRPANLAGVPAISLPCGFAPSGLPIGLQIMGGVSSEAVLLRIAHAYESTHPQQRRPDFSRLNFA